MTPGAAQDDPRDLWSFEGHWSLSREIDDRRAGHVARAEGEAEMRRDAAGLVYAEEVRLVLPGQRPVTGTRRYLWRPGLHGVAVSFEDGRPFHDFALGTGHAESAHWCDPDQYDVHYDFSGWPRWTSLWCVAGPAKDYRMLTRYAPTKVPGA
ncbi:hypothetical protein DU478_06715 [Thalassococcus profundi]|uniref:DUF6314 domain-containing protein n=1 Tax=Thalassococcus profundi TaxID=2282382 RepID=A0A369TSJ1_9RHOB|nr:DUF6314 family protein [Thalassococcus profundi]RDD67405.1 hypothetical protein DU478_06715 [Thalassococcus profundi]